MKISVIIPSYKPQDYLWECLNSLYSQTLPKEGFEVILVLNGCNQPYFNQIYAWLSKHQDMQVSFIQTDHGGVSNARNMALDVVKGEYITFIDDDDYVSPTYLEELYKKASPTCVSLCYPLSFVDGTDKYFPYYITKDYEKFSANGEVSFSMPRRFFAGPVYKLIHRDIIGNRRFNVNFKNGEDSLFMFLISDRLKNVSFTSKNAVYYRRLRQDSATANARNILFSIRNRMRLAFEYTKIYFSHPQRYSFRFYASAIFSSFKAVIYEIMTRNQEVRMH